MTTGSQPVVRGPRTWWFTSKAYLFILQGYKLGLSRPILNNLGFFLKPQKVRFLGFLGVLIFKSEFLLFRVKLCKFL